MRGQTDRETDRHRSNIYFASLATAKVLAALFRVHCMFYVSLWSSLSIAAPNRTRDVEYCDGRSRSVGVCHSVCHTASLCKRGSTDQRLVWGGDSQIPKIIFHEVDATFAKLLWPLCYSSGHSRRSVLRFLSDCSQHYMAYIESHIIRKVTVVNDSRVNLSAIYLGPVL